MPLTSTAISMDSGKRQYNVKEAAQTADKRASIKLIKNAILKNGMMMKIDLVIPVCIMRT